MAKRKSTRAGSTQPDWKTKWPRNGDLATWFRYMLQKCEAIDDDRQATDRAHLPIEHLAEAGHKDQAIRWVNRFLKRLPNEAVLETVRLAELGAKVCLDTGNLKLMEKYLAKASATESFNTRKCDQGYSINSVRDFRADNGILDPDNAVDEDQRIKAEFWGAHRRFKQALDARRKKKARLAVAEMEKVATELPAIQKWTEGKRIIKVIVVPKRMVNIVVK